MIIRDACVDDAEDIARVHVAAWRVAYRGIVPDEMMARLSVAVRADHARAAISAGPPGRIAVAEIDGEVAGWLRVGPARDPDPPGEVELFALYLAPWAWGRGAGLALLEVAVAEGATYLWTLEGNARARRFYERHGWTCDGTLREVDLSPVAPGTPPTLLTEIRYRRW